MIFLNYKLFTMVELPHSKHTSVFRDIWHHYIDLRLFSKTFIKLSLN